MFLMGLPPYSYFLYSVFKSLEESQGINIYILHSFLLVEIVVFNIVLTVLLVKEGES